MTGRRELKILRELRTLAANQHLIGDEQYEKELKRLLADIKANIASPELNEVERKKLTQLLNTPGAY